MRCYLMTKGRISSVEFLSMRTDEGRIAEAREIFEKLAGQRGADGFEVWDGGRFVYRYPEERA
jgi:hypothetical protein